MEAHTEMTDLENWEEQQHDPRDYPDGFDPNLYDLGAAPDTIEAHPQRWAFPFVP